MEKQQEDERVLIPVTRRTRKELKVLCAEEGKTFDEMIMRLISVYK